MGRFVGRSGFGYVTWHVDHDTDESCPKCHHMLYKLDGKYGEFLSCSNSQCSYTRSLHKSRSQSMRKDCPECDGKLVLRNGKYGKFYGCTNYPQCKYTEDYDDV